MVRLRLILAAEGLLPPDHEGRHDALVLFDAVKAEPVLKASADTMGKPEVERFLGVSRVERLVEGGVIRPMVRPVRKRVCQYEFLRDDVERLMEKLTRRIAPAGACPWRVSDIYTVARRTRLTLGEVVGLIANGSFTWVGSLDGKHGFEAIVVKEDEIKPLIRTDDIQGLTRSQIVKALRMRKQTVDRLIDSGILPSQRMRSPFKRMMGDVVLFADIECFKHTYISLANLAKDRRSMPRQMKGTLSSQGIEPALTAEQAGSTFYLRSSLT